MTLWRPAAVLVVWLSCAVSAFAETLRVATFNTDLERDGPGLLLRDIQGGKDAQIEAVIEAIAQVAPDVLALQGIDWDYDGAALSGLVAALDEAGVSYPYQFARQPNSGVATGVDLNGDRRRGDPEDAQGYGAFTGQGGLAVLSRFPIIEGGVQDFSTVLWRDLPGALLPSYPDGRPFPSAEALAVQRLSSTAHWAVPVRLPDGQDMTLLTFQAGPPVFDGAEDRNGRRNHDEILFWRHYLDGAFGAAPSRRFVIAGGANLDPVDSDGRRAAVQALLDDPRLRDVEPASQAAALDTVDWPGIGRFRVDYILPSRDWAVAGAGVFWPLPDAPGHDVVLRASRHRLVWIDLRLD